MNFWDSSALLPLIVEQSSTARAESYYKQESRGVFVWWGTVTECFSALARLERSNSLSSREVEQALKALAKLADSWSEILPSDILRAKANRLLRFHPLRTGDAFQLASALIASEDLASRVSMVTFDARLGTAARREGLEVLE